MVTRSYSTSTTVRSPSRNTENTIRLTCVPSRPQSTPIFTKKSQPKAPTESNSYKSWFDTPPNSNNLVDLLQLLTSKPKRSLSNVPSLYSHTRCSPKSLSSLPPSPLLPLPPLFPEALTSATLAPSTAARTLTSHRPLWLHWPPPSSALTSPVSLASLVPSAAASLLLVAALSGMYPCCIRGFGADNRIVALNNPFAAPTTPVRSSVFLTLFFCLP
jgi:hypothetical protein